MTEYNDHPLREVELTAISMIEDGGTIFQKFTCEKCNTRQTMELPNVLYTMGSCEECGHITNIEEKGCNLLIIFSS